MGLANMPCTQVDWLQFTNYDMAFELVNVDLTPATVRELGLWQHISRSALVETTKDLANVRDDVLGEMTAMRNTLQAKDAELESKITLYEKVTQSELEAMIADPDEAAYGVIYMAEDGTGALKMYTKDEGVMKELGGGGTAAIMAVIGELQARIDALENI